MVATLNRHALLAYLLGVVMVAASVLTLDMPHTWTNIIAWLGLYFGAFLIGRNVGRA